MLVLILFRGDRCHHMTRVRGFYSRVSAVSVGEWAGYMGWLHRRILLLLLLGLYEGAFAALGWNIQVDSPRTSGIAWFHSCGLRGGSGVDVKGLAYHRRRRRCPQCPLPLMNILCRSEGRCGRSNRWIDRLAHLLYVLKACYWSLVARVTSAMEIKRPFSLLRARAGPSLVTSTTTHTTTIAVSRGKHSYLRKWGFVSIFKS